jgi:hypothetical protein
MKSRKESNTKEKHQNGKNYHMTFNIKTEC